MPPLIFLVPLQNHAVRVRKTASFSWDVGAWRGFYFLHEQLRIPDLVLFNGLVMVTTRAACA